MLPLLNSSNLLPTSVHYPNILFNVALELMCQVFIMGNIDIQTLEEICVVSLLSTEASCHKITRFYVLAIKTHTNRHS